MNRHPLRKQRNTSGSTKMQIILLPGMDGTGLLFEPFIRELSKHIPEDLSVQAISYPCDQDLNYMQLIDYVRSRLPTEEEIILVAESFSGPIGFAMATEQPNKIRAIVFVATFLSPPKGLIWMLPPRLMATLMGIPLPIFFLKLLLFEQGTANETVTLFRTASGKVKRSVLAMRMRETTGLRIKRRSLEMPCAYIRAANDRLISGSHAEEFRIIAPHIRLFTIPGPHFIMHARPEQCAQVVGEYLKQITILTL